GPLRPAVSSFWTVQECRQSLQRHARLPALRPPGGRIMSAPLAGLHDLVERDVLRFNLLPEPMQCRQGDRRRGQGATDAPPAACEAPPQRLLLSTAEESKTAFLTKILGGDIVCLSVSRVRA